MPPAVLVTGAAGFIGSELVAQLLAGGHRVIGLDNLATGSWANLDGLTDGVERITGDVRDCSLLSRILPGIATVFHLACLGVRHSLHAPRETHDVNATGTLLLLDAARAAGVRRFVHVSSSEVYGTARTVPMSESHPTFPSTPYGASKLAGEAYARAFFASYGFGAAIVRPFNTYGPRCHHEGDSGEVIPKFLLRAAAGLPLVIFGDGAQTRDFTFVSDTARGILAAGMADGAAGGTFNLGSGRETSIHRLAALCGSLAARVGKGSRSVELSYDAPRPGDVRRLVADATLARSVLGFEPTVSLEEGVARLADWYVSRGVPAEELLQREVVHNWVSR